MFRSAFEFKFDEDCMEIPKGISMTIPHQALSLQDIIERSILGANVPDIAQTIEDGEDDNIDDAIGVDTDLLDVMEAQNYLEKYRQALIENQEAIKAKNKAVEATEEKNEPDPIDEPKNV